MVISLISKFNSISFFSHCCTLTKLVQQLSFHPFVDKHLPYYEVPASTRLLFLIRFYFRITLTLLPITLSNFYEIVTLRFFSSEPLLVLFRSISGERGDQLLRLTYGTAALSQITFIVAILMQLKNIQNLFLAFIVLYRPLAHYNTVLLSPSCPVNTSHTNTFVSHPMNSTCTT